MSKRYAGNRLGWRQCRVLEMCETVAPEAASVDDISDAVFGEYENREEAFFRAQALVSDLEARDLVERDPSDGSAWLTIAGQAAADDLQRLGMPTGKSGGKRICGTGEDILLRLRTEGPQTRSAIEAWKRPDDLTSERCVAKWVTDALKPLFQRGLVHRVRGTDEDRIALTPAGQAMAQGIERAREAAARPAPRIAPAVPVGVLDVVGARRGMRLRQTVEADGSVVWEVL